MTYTPLEPLSQHPEQPLEATFAGYTVVRWLGSGAMGEVYLAEHPRLPRRDALKILRTDVSADEDYRQRFIREADLAATLWHPNIVRVNDRGEFDGQLWIAMDFVDGMDAARLLATRYPIGMPLDQVAAIVAAVADALDYAHQRGLLHRDVKPANILVANTEGDEQRILLGDFGIARSIADISGLTATNMTIGTLLYAAPEQLMAEEIDGRADQYALACTAFHLLTGEPPFANSNPAVVIGNHLSSPPPRLGRLRADLGSFENVLAKAMAKEPFLRFDTCREFAAALSQCDVGYISPTADTQLATHVPTPFREGTHREQTTRNGSDAASTYRRIALIASGIATLLAVAVVAFIGARLAQPPSAPPTPSPPQPSSTRQEVERPEPPQTVTHTPPPVTVTPPPAPPRPSPSPAPVPTLPPGDLGLPTPMSYPNCNGRGIVVLGNVTTPGTYAAGVQNLLNAHPGASYLRTDQACPSLRQESDEGNPIYAVFKFAGTTQREVCTAVRAAGGGAYGKWLDYSTDPAYIIPC
jgi:serine/threonine-protein kinase